MTVASIGENMHIHNAKSWDELCRLASFEQTGNLILYRRQFGHSGVLTANVLEDLWDKGGTRTRLTTASTMTCVSSSANDVLGNTGCGYLQIQGVDQNYDLQTETITMNGTTPVEGTITFLSLHSIRSVFNGSAFANVGNITVTATTGGSTQAYMAATDGLSHMSHFTVPAGYTAFIMSSIYTVFRSSGGSGDREAEVAQMVFIPAANAVYRTIQVSVRSSGGAYTGVPRVPSQTPEKTTVWLTVNPETTGTIVTSSQEIVLVKGDYNFRTEI